MMYNSMKKPTTGGPMPKPKAMATDRMFASAQDRATKSVPMANPKLKAIQKRLGK